MPTVTLDITEGATHYHATYVRPDWARTKTKTARIGRHIFYRWKSDACQIDIYNYFGMLVINFINGGISYEKEETKLIHIRNLLTIRL